MRPGILDNSKMHSMFHVTYEYRRLAGALHIFRFCLIACSLGYTELSTPTLGADDFDLPPISYSQTPPNNLLTDLLARTERGEKVLEHRPPHGYLPDLLTALQIPSSSQLLVFAKTSLQRHHISPRTPRAIYFNDEVYVGYIPRADLLEISVADPQLGTVFYTLDQREPQHLRLKQQQDTCFSCHAGGQTKGVPGHLFRSLYVNERGQPILAAGSFRVDHTTPFHERWGGWYVTGEFGDMSHLGNRSYSSPDAARAAAADIAQGNITQGNIINLYNQILTDEYMSSSSDLVALMVFGHQIGGHNLLTKALYQVKTALYREEALNRELHNPTGNRWNSTQIVLNHSADQLLKYFLFADEAWLPEPVRRSGSFADEFQALGPHDSRGRSLREFDLQQRLFKYPCSYLIYSRSMRALPEPFVELFWTRLKELLLGSRSLPPGVTLTAEQRQAIYEILLETHPDAPRWWR